MEGGEGPGIVIVGAAEVPPAVMHEHPEPEGLLARDIRNQQFIQAVEAQTWIGDYWKQPTRQYQGKELSYVDKDALLSETIAYGPTYLEEQLDGSRVVENHPEENPIRKLAQYATQQLELQVTHVSRRDAAEQIKDADILTARDRALALVEEAKGIDRNKLLTNVNKPYAMGKIVDDEYVISRQAQLEDVLQKLLIKRYQAAHPDEVVAEYSEVKLTPDMARDMLSLVYLFSPNYLNQCRKENA